MVVDPSVCLGWSSRVDVETMAACMGLLFGAITHQPHHPQPTKTPQRYAIENATRTRIVVADSHVHVLGSFANIKLARDAICSLILGAPPGKVYNQLRNVAKRLAERF